VDWRDRWRWRFTVSEGLATSHETIVELLRRVTLEGFDFIRIENLRTFDGEPGFSFRQEQWRRDKLCSSHSRSCPGSFATLQTNTDSTQANPA
jgi:hypothetical protein